MNYDKDSNDLAFERFDDIATDGVCNKILPSNKIKTKFNFYKITSFEYQLTEDLLGEIPEPNFVSNMLDVSYVLPLELPLQLLSPSDHIHARTNLTKIDSSTNEDWTIAFTNFGTLLPVEDLSLAENEIVKDILFVRDADYLKKGELRYKDKTLKLTKRNKTDLMEHGYYYATPDNTSKKKKSKKEDIGSNKKVKVILDPVEVLEVGDLAKLEQEKKLAFGQEDKKVEVSARQLEQIARGNGGVAILDSKTVWLKTRRYQNNLTKSSQRQNFGNSSLSTQEKLRSSINYTGLHPERLNFYQQIDQSSYCKYFATVLADERAPEEYKLYSPVVIDHFADVLKNLNINEYNAYLDFFLNNSRSEYCVNYGLPAPNPDLPHYEIGVVSRYEQEWELLGYSKGSLLSSINLAPGEEMQIEIFTWDKHKVEQEKSFGSEYEFNREFNHLAKAETTITRDMKEALSANADANMNISLPMSKVQGGGGLSGGAEWSNEKQFATDVNLISEASVKSAEKFKATHQVKIVETHEFGEENRTIRKIKNINSSRTLTFNYFEILENYNVTTRLVNASEFCLLVENPRLPAFDIDFVMAYEYLLQQVLLSPNYRGGFEAARILAAQHWFEKQSAVEESLNRPDIPQSKTTPSDSNTNTNNSPESTPIKGIFATAETITKILEEFIKLDIQSSLTILSKHHNPIDQTSYSKQQIEDAQADIAQYSFWFKLMNIYPGFDKSAKTYVENTTGEFGKKSHETTIINALKTLVDQFDDDWLYSVKMFAASTVVQGIMKLPFLITGPAAPVIIGLLEPVILPIAYNHDDRGLSKAISNAKKDLLAIVDTQNAVITHEQVEMPGTESEQIPPTSMQVPRLYSFRELAEAHADFKKLIVHLEKHRTYYSNEIWRAEDENERFRRLEQLRVIKFVENRLIGFAGTKAVYPLKEEALPSSFTLAPFRQDIDTKLEPHQKQKEEILSVPTAGVHMDTLLGQCDALEPHLISLRDLDLRMAEAQTTLLELSVKEKLQALDTTPLPNEELNQ